MAPWEVSVRNNEEPEELEKATGSGYGTVNLGQLHDKQTMPVATALDRNPRVEQFKNEVDSASHTRDKNSDGFDGSSIPFEPSVFVYEFVPNRTGNDHLHGQGIHLNWSPRIQIAI